jgi:hypothetical protein
LTAGDFFVVKGWTVRLAGENVAVKHIQGLASSPIPVSFWSMIARKTFPLDIYIYR